MRSPRLTAFSAILLLTLLSCSGNSNSGLGDPTDNAGGASGTSGALGGAPASSAGAGAASGSPSSAGGTASGGQSSAGAANGGQANGGQASAGADNGGSSGGGAPPSAAGNAGAGTAGAAHGGAGTGGASAAGGTAGSAGSTVVFPPNCTCLGLGPPACVPTGHVTYTLAKAAAPTADQKTAYDLITCAMDGAVAYYNCNTSITKQLNVTYDTGVPTADGNFNGSVRFGGHSYMECATGMHETSHAVGIGTAPKWSTYSVGGVFTGTNAIAQLRAITGNATDVLHSDTQHFWPYGLNYASEAKSTADLIDHCLMVTAIRTDLGLQ